MTVIGSTGAPPPQRVGLGRYVSTATVGLLNVAGSLLVSALLARAWSSGDFLFYNALNRYVGLLFAITSFSLGFGIVKYAHARDRDAPPVLWNALLVTALLNVAALAALLPFRARLDSFFEVGVFTHGLALPMVLAWVAAHAVYHCVFSFLRGTDQLPLANGLSFAVNSVAAITVAAAAVLGLVGGVPSFYAGVALLQLAAVGGALYAQGSPLEARTDAALGAGMVGYSASRFVDSILRQLFIVGITSTMLGLDRGEMAGQLSILYTLIRAAETAFQPLVLVILADAFASDDEAQTRQVQELWSGIRDVALFATVAAIVLSPVLLEVWLGPRYAGLAPGFRILALAIWPVSGTMLMRGYVDRRHAFSPFVWINVGAFTLVVPALLLLESSGRLTLESASAATCVVLWLQFLVVTTLIRRHFAISLLGSAVVPRHLRALLGRMRAHKPGERS